MIESLVCTAPYSGAAGPTNSTDYFVDHPQQRSSKHRVAHHGSLPLKKRLRFLPPHHGFSQEGLSSSQEALPTSHGSDIHDQATTRTPPADLFQTDSNHTSCNTSDEKLVALALIAAATSTESDVVQFSSSSSSPCSLPPLGQPSTATTETSSEEASSDFLSRNHSGEESSSVTVVQTQTSKQGTTTRIHPPPLAHPLPNGCHFRTSRNNSFCRRHPCYNESKYCKLHYHHFKIAAENKQQRQQQGKVGADVAQQLLAMSMPQQIVSHDSGGGVTSEGVLVGEPTMSTASRPTLETTNASLPSPAHQDRRFSSATNGEPRCKATTTRGRPCAYVAVNTTKYCYLHADYDSNPPPRRGGACQLGVLPQKRKALVDTGKKQFLPGTTVAVALGASKSRAGTQKGPPRASCNKGGNERSIFLASIGSTSSPRLEAPSDLYTGLTLLSMISSDRWYQKAVIVATGPLIHRVGTVQKWGNGWVTVRIPDMGVHNRRSFELYLHPNQEEDGGYQTQQPNEVSLHVDAEAKTNQAALSNAHQELENRVASTSPCFSTDGSFAPTASNHFVSMSGSSNKVTADREDSTSTPVPEASSLLMFLQNKHHSTAMVTPIATREIATSGELSLRNGRLEDSPYIVSPLGVVKAGLGAA